MQSNKSKFNKNQKSQRLKSRLHTLSIYQMGPRPGAAGYQPGQGVPCGQQRWSLRLAFSRVAEAASPIVDACRRADAAVTSSRSRPVVSDPTDADAGDGRRTVLVTVVSGMGGSGKVSVAADLQRRSNGLLVEPPIGSKLTTYNSSRTAGFEDCKTKS